MLTSTTPDPLPESREDAGDISFFHSEITVGKWYKIWFSDEALVELEALIKTIQSSFSEEQEALRQGTTEIIRDTTEATKDILIESGKEWKLRRLVRRLLKREQWTLGEKWRKKMEDTITKYAPIIFQNVTIRYKDVDWIEKIFPVPIIVRPWLTLHSMLAFQERASMSPNIKKKNNPK